jgi:hypothetical protein
MSLSPAFELVKKANEWIPRETMKAELQEAYYSEVFMTSE